MARDIHPTKHALENMKARDVTWAEIVDVVNNPTVVYGPDYRGRKNVQKGDLCVVLGEDGGVITVLLATEGNWNNDQARGRKKNK